MTNDELMREMHGDLKVLRRESETAKESRERIHRDIEEVKDAIEQNRRCIQKQRAEIVRITAVFGVVSTFLSAWWVGLLGWMKWFPASHR